MNITLFSGYHDNLLTDGICSKEFILNYWYPNVQKQGVSNDDIYICNTGKQPPVDLPVHWVSFNHNLGHNAGKGRKMQESQLLSGGSAMLMTGCMIAYCRNTDLVYQEQDCLAFGNWIDQLYKEIGNKGGIIGRTNLNGPATSLTANSLLLIKHGFLTEFVRRYLAISQSDTKSGFEPERKMESIRDEGHLATMSFGVDRSRPLTIKAPVWYAQQWTKSELEEIKTEGLI